MQFGDLNPVLGKIITLLKQIEHNTSCAICFSVSPSSDTSGVVPAGAKYLKVEKTNGVGTVTITFPDSSTYDLTADGQIFEIPLSHAKLPEITIASGDGGTWVWTVLS